MLPYVSLIYSLCSICSVLPEDRDMSFGRSNSEFLAPPSASADSYRRHSWDGTTGKDSSLPDPSSTKTPHHCNGLLKNSLPESLEEAEKEHDIKESSSWWFNSWWRSPKGRL